MIDEEIKVLVAVLGLPEHPCCCIQAHLSHLAEDGLVWQGYLAGSSKTAARILFFSIIMGGDSSSKLIFMPT